MLCIVCSDNVGCVTVDPGKNWLCTGKRKRRK